jgi:hypothetical protein
MGQLDTPAVQKRRRPDKEGIGSLATHRFEGGIDLGAGVGVEHLDLQPHVASSHVNALQLSLGLLVSRIDEHCDTDEPGKEFTQELQPLTRHLGIEKIDSRHVAARSREARDEAEPHRIVPDEENDRDRLGCGLGAKVDGVPSAAITATWRRTKSAASSGNRSS